MLNMIKLSALIFMCHDLQEKIFTFHILFREILHSNEFIADNEHKRQAIGSEFKEYDFLRLLSGSYVTFNIDTQ